MKNIYLLLILLSNTLIATAQNRETTPIKEVIEAAIQQQVLAQEVTKVYFTLLDNLSEPKYYRYRDAAIENFDKNLAQMKLLIPNNKIREGLQQMGASWEAYKKVAAWSINREGAESLLDQIEKMVENCQTLLLLYEQYAQETGDVYQAGELAKVIGSIKRVAAQKKLTYEITVYALALKHEIGISIFLKKQLEKYGNQYDLLLYDMSAEPINSQRITAEIVALQKQWGSLSELIKKIDKNTTTEPIITLCHEMSKQANQLEQLYRELGKKLSISKTINTISTQRALAQKIVKSYVALGNEQQIVKHKREINNSITTFEESTAALLKAAPTEAIASNIKVLQTMWKNYKVMATDWNAATDGVSGGKLLEKNYIIMASCDRVAQSVEKYAQTIPEYQAFFKQGKEKVALENNIAMVVKKIGGQCVYVERIATYYMLCAMDQDKGMSTQRLQASISEYDSAIELLVKCRFNDATISYKLQSCEEDWAKIKDYCAAPQVSDMAAMLQSSEQLSLKLQELNVLYEQKMDELLIKESSTIVD